LKAKTFIDFEVTINLKRILELWSLGAVFVYREVKGND
jgi:hypothetical protein